MAILRHEIQKRSLQCSDDVLLDVASKCEGYDAYDLVLYPFFLGLCDSASLKFQVYVSSLCYVDDFVCVIDIEGMQSY